MPRETRSLALQASRHSSGSPHGVLLRRQPFPLTPHILPYYSGVLFVMQNYLTILYVSLMTGTYGNTQESPQGERPARTEVTGAAETATPGQLAKLHSIVTEMEHTLADGNLLGSMCHWLVACTESSSRPRRTSSSRSFSTCSRRPASVISCAALSSLVARTRRLLSIGRF